MKIYFLIGVLFFISRSSFANQSDLDMKPLLNAVYCEALLKLNPSEKVTQPLGSLRQLQDLLKKRLPNKSIQTSSPEMLYLTTAYEGQFNEKLKAVGALDAYILSRLRTLDQQTTVGYSPDYSYVGIEFRGKEAIRSHLDQVRLKIEQVNLKVWEELEKNFPSVMLKEMKSLYLMGLSFSAIIFGMEPDFLVSQILLGSLLGLNFLERVYIPLLNKLKLQKLKAKKQLEVIEKSLMSLATNDAFFLISDSFIAKTSYHENIVNEESSPLIEDMVSASEHYVKHPFYDDSYEEIKFDERYKNLSAKEKEEMAFYEFLNSIVLYPEGIYRYIFYDSLFYRDPETQEPVWLIYYRAFKTNPIKKSKGPPANKKNKDKKLDWNLLPGLNLPINPIPIQR